MVQKKTQLQALRAIAMALIVADHQRFLVQGAVGNAIFFGLSGFLVIKPFAGQSARFTGARDFLSFYLRKLRAILPTYYLLLLFVQLWQDLPSPVGDLFASHPLSWSDLWRCMTFTACPGHLWFIQQIMVMYLVAPFVVVLLSCLTKIIRRPHGDLVRIAALALLTWGTYRYLTPDVFYLNGNGRPQVFRIWQFMVGMAFGYLYRYIKETTGTRQIPMVWQHLLGLATWGLLLSTVGTSYYFLHKVLPHLGKYYIGWERPILCTVLAGILILLVVLADRSLASRFLSHRFFALAGDVSFEIYLVHWYLLHALRLTGLSYCDAAITYGASLVFGLAFHRAIVELEERIPVPPGGKAPPAPTRLGTPPGHRPSRT